MSTILTLGFSDEEIDRLRSKASRLAVLMPEIEQLMKSGVSRQAIVNRLNEQGFDLTMKTFATMLGRLRKREVPPSRKNSAAIRAPGRLGPAAREHAKQVHQQFTKGAKDRPATVQHDLNKVPEW